MVVASLIAMPNTHPTVLMIVEISRVEERMFRPCDAVTRNFVGCELVSLVGAMAVFAIR